MNSLVYSVETDGQIYQAIKPTKKFISEIIRNFDTITFTKAGKRIKTTNRTSKYKRDVQLRKNTNLNNLTKVMYGVRYATRKHLVELQTYRFTRSIEKMDIFFEMIDVELVNLVSCNIKSNKILVKTNQPLSHMGMYLEVYIENQDMNETFKNTYLKYVYEFLEVPYLYSIKYSNEQLIRFHKYYKEIEVLKNLKAFSLIRSIARGNQDMRTITLNTIKKNKKWLKHDLNFRQIKDLSYINRFYKLNDEIISKVRDNSISKIQIEQILNFEIENGITNRKLLRYLDKQNRALRYYSDYLSMLRQLDRDVFYWSVLYPKNLVTAHDSLTLAIREQKKLEKNLEIEEENKKYMKKYELLKELNIESENYSFIVPEAINEIIREGKTLQHCVYSDRYLKSHANDSLIVFIRETSKIEDPYFTAELSLKGELLQLHGYGNENGSAKGQVAAKERPKVKEFVSEVLDSSKFQRKFNQVINRI